jgi:hypothetical protein
MTSSYDSETVTLLRAILEDAWERLTFEQRARTQKSEVALRILRLVRQGEQLALLGTNSRRPLPLGGLRVTKLQNGPAFILSVGARGHERYSGNN